ncbi:hypothetical protein [Pseudomonas sp. Gutcm_11s]|uniref:hypothetical protein n=1 Tax=Pseudomonas sp. Gutcm_11s TaxID=3026088 RepID=UPI00235E07CD|nr:hypothetical protein [Pseudomonas sp. Gutcm_11s]MDD0841456.1 hypothetical protein [Pseudomonas sp. Gutcm_11s]
MIYAGPGGFERSEMLAPALLLAEPGASISCHFDGGREVSSPCIKHPAGKWSTATATNIVIVYFDPLSFAGRAIQTYSDNSEARSIPFATSIYEEYFHQLISGNINAREVIALVQKLGEDLTKGVKPPHLDRRVAIVANDLAENSAGRLDLKRLSALISTSPERLRHLFKSQVNMTLSKYKSWRQLYTMSCHILRTCGGEYDWTTSPALQQAGFYDDAHGYRTLSQYFGARASLTELHLNLVDCTEA